MRVRTVTALVLAMLAAGSVATPTAAPAAGVPDPSPVTSPASGDPRGTVLLIHGGAWAHHGPVYALREHRRHAARLNALGYRTVSITYRPGAHALPDVVAFYDRLRRRVGPRRPVCALGDSAGGHLSLMLAARRPGLDCAISRGAPTDLRFAHGEWLRAVERRLAPHVPLARISPVTHASSLAGRALASHGLQDPVVDHGQLVRLRRAARGRIQTMSLPPGPADYAHAGVAAPALHRLEHAEAQMLAAASRGYGAGSGR